MFGVSRRFAAVSVAAEVGADHRVVLREPGGDFVPHSVGLRITVDHQKRGAAAPLNQIYSRSRCVYLQLFKPFEHAHHPYCITV